jgi:hypothetical protein
MQKRNPWIILLLSIVTLGIYTIYWLYVTRKEMVAVLNDKKAIWPVSVLAAPLAVILALIVLQLVINGAEGAVVASFFLVSAIAMLALLVLPFIWFYKYSNAIAKVSHHTDHVTLYVLWIVLNFVGVGFIWLVLAQNEMNKATEVPQDAQPMPGTAPDTGVAPTPAQSAAAPDLAASPVSTPVPAPTPAAPVASAVTPPAPTTPASPATDSSDKTPESESETATKPADDETPAAPTTPPTEPPKV